MIRTLYLYLFALIGLILIAIGSVRLVDMALRVTLFTGADAEQRIASPPPAPPVRIEEARAEAAGDSALTPDERAQLRTWLEERDVWEDEWRAVDRVRARRHRDAANALAFLIVGLPLYLYHWRTIRRESRTGPRSA